MLINEYLPGFQPDIAEKTDQVHVSGFYLRGGREFGCSWCGDETTSLAGGLPSLISTARAASTPNEINGYASVTKVSLNVEEDRLCFDFERNGFRQVYLSKTGYS